MKPIAIIGGAEIVKTFEDPTEAALYLWGKNLEPDAYSVFLNLSIVAANMSEIETDIRKGIEAIRETQLLRMMNK